MLGYCLIPIVGLSGLSGKKRIIIIYLIITCLMNAVFLVCIVQVYIRDCDLNENVCTKMEHGYLNTKHDDVPKRKINGPN